VCVTWLAEAAMTAPVAAFRDFVVERGGALLGGGSAERDR
jgi:hypothetical protein